MTPSPGVQEAMNLLRQTGTRFFQLSGTAAVGVWSDQDGPTLRSALRTLGLDRLPLRYLDGEEIARHLKLRKIPGEPVPMSVLRVMQRDPSAGWRIRDAMRLKGARR